jgi:hypothetical protein
MSVFGPCDGGVLKVVTNCGVQTAVIKVDGFIATVPITGFTLELGTNHQFLHSLDEFIYVFAFGDRIGELTLSGMTFTNTNTCGSQTAGAAPGDIYSFYMANRLSRNLTPAKITINGANTSLLGFLTGFREEMPNPALPIVQWVLRYNVVINPATS